MIQHRSYSDVPNWSTMETHAWKTKHELSDPSDKAWWANKFMKFCKWFTHRFLWSSQIFCKNFQKMLHYNSFSHFFLNCGRSWWDKDHQLLLQRMQVKSLATARCTQLSTTPGVRDLTPFSGLSGGPVIDVTPIHINDEWVTCSRSCSEETDEGWSSGSHSRARTSIPLPSYLCTGLMPWYTDQPAAWIMMVSWKHWEVRVPSFVVRAVLWPCVCHLWLEWAGITHRCLSWKLL